jgi:hypothetical protein
MSYFDQYFMKPIIGMITKRGAVPTSAVPNPFTLHNFAKRNVQVRRYASYYCPSPLIHRSRTMGGY